MIDKLPPASLSQFSIMANAWLDATRQSAPCKNKLFSFELYATTFHNSSGFLSPIPFPYLLFIEQFFLMYQGFFSIVVCLTILLQNLA